MKAFMLTASRWRKAGFKTVMCRCFVCECSVCLVLSFVVLSNLLAPAMAAITTHPAPTPSPFPTGNPSFPGGGPTAWAAERALAADPARAAAFDASASLAEGRDILFLGEMVFPWMFDEVAALAPLAGVAATLAARADWPRLYDPAALAANRVPVAAAVYWEDMRVQGVGRGWGRRGECGAGMSARPHRSPPGRECLPSAPVSPHCALTRPQPRLFPRYVDFDLSQATARTVRGLRQWVTNEFLHSGIRDDGGRVFDGLLGLVRGSAPLV